MKKRVRKSHTVRTGVLFGVGTFVALSFLAGGLIQISHDVGFFQWFADMLYYTITNKLIQKLIAAFVVGGFAAFVSSMIAYGKAIKHNKVQRVQFQETHKSENSTRIA